MSDETKPVDPIYLGRGIDDVKAATLLAYLNYLSRPVYGTINLVSYTWASICKKLDINVKTNEKENAVAAAMLNKHNVAVVKAEYAPKAGDKFKFTFNNGEYGPSLSASNPTRWANAFFKWSPYHVWIQTEDSSFVKLGDAIVGGTVTIDPNKKKVKSKDSSYFDDSDKEFITWSNGIHNFRIDALWITQVPWFERSSLTAAWNAIKTENSTSSDTDPKGWG